VSSVKTVGQDRQPKPLGAFLLLASTWFVVQALVASPFLVRTCGAWFRTNGSSWERDDAVAILLFLLLESVLGAFLLWRSRKSASFVLHAAKGIIYGVLSFLIAAPLVYLVLNFLYKPVPTMPPHFVFVLLFFLGHRVPLLGIALGGFLASAVHQVLRVNQAQT
jgi:hypothetical protein